MEYNGIIMTDKTIIAAALKAGFCAAELIKTKDIPVDSAFRRYCEENLCGQYNANYSCPPDCGSFEKMTEKLLKKGRAIVVQSVTELAGYTQSEFSRAKEKHRVCMAELENVMRQNGFSGFAVGAGNCTLCTPCMRQKGLLCKFPDKAYSCMSAYCIDVKKLCKICGMEYERADGLALFGMYVFE